MIFASEILLISLWLFRIYFFFFSSRRRHTRFDCDWSSDVCSSDLVFPVFRRVMILKIGNDFFCGGIRDRRAKSLDHLVDFRVPGRRRQWWLHGDVPRAVAHRAKALRFRSPFSFRQFGGKGRERSHGKIAVLRELWGNGLR